MNYIKSGIGNKLTDRNSKFSSLLFFTAVTIISATIKTLQFFFFSLFYYIAVVEVCAAFVAVFFCALSFRKNIYDNRYFFFYGALVLYMIFVGAMRTLFYMNISNGELATMIASDFSHVMLFLLGAAYANKDLNHYYVSMMKILGGFSLICGLYAFTLYSYSDAMSTFRGGGLWDKPYCLWWMTYATFAFLFCYAKITGKSRFLGYSLFVVYVLLGFMFLKRIAVVEAATLLLATTLLKNYKDNKGLSKTLFKLFILLASIGLLVLIIAIIANSVPFVRTITTNIMDRFMGNDTVLDYDRADETSRYFSIATIDEIIFGQGIGRYLAADKFYSLHIGFANVVFKGGLVFAAFWVMLIIKTIRMIIRRKEVSDMGIVCLCVTVMALVDLCFAFGWSSTIGVFGYATPIIYVLQYDLPPKKNKLLKVSERLRLQKKAKPQKSKLIK